MSTNGNALPALVLTLALAAACGDADPTAVDGLLPDTPALSQGPGQLTAGQIPETGVLRGEIPNSLVCGIEVTTTVFDAGADWPAPFGPPVREAGMNILTWTNEDNGQWIASRVAGQTTREIVEFFPDGSFKVHEVISNGVQLRTATGAPLALSAGRLILEFVVVLLPGGDFELTNLEFLFVAGPRNDGNWLNSPEFCALVEDALL